MGMLVHRSNRELASRFPEMDVQSALTIPAFSLSDTLVTETYLAKFCSAMDYSGFQASCHSMFKKKNNHLYTKH
jgi:hypothetical protein